MPVSTEVVEQVLITGGTGFVGAAIARALAEKHPRCTIIILDINPPGPVHIVPSGISFIQADVTSQAEVSTAIQQVKPDIIVHTAGIVPALSERFERRLERHVWKVNVEGTRHMLHAAKHSGVKCFIYTSTSCIVTDHMDVPYQNIDESWPTPPTSLIYGESKAAAEAMVLEGSSDTMATCSLRPSVLCGPGDYQLVPAIHACIAKGQTPFIIGNGQNLWDVTYVTNVADAHVLAIENLLSSKTAAGQAFFIQNNEPITFRDFCLAIWAQFGHTPPFEIRIPEILTYLVGLICEFLTWIFGTATTLSRGSVRDACSVRFASGEKAKRILGYEARIGIEHGIRLSCEDYARRIGIELPMQQAYKKDE
ncbi:erg26, C-3 sterol dehydrogenase [Aspergillus hancockii]|nr:erg26, C-3 sterol dehydrogenase [Aspergillus hancockii]